MLPFLEYLLILISFLLHRYFFEIVGIARQINKVDFKSFPQKPIRRQNSTRLRGAVFSKHIDKRIDQSFELSNETEAELKEIFTSRLGGRKNSSYFILIFQLKN